MCTWKNPTLTVTTDSKKRVVMPGAAPGDVFACQSTGNEVILRRHREPARKRLRKAQALKAIRTWKSVPNIRWPDLRKMTREL
jgi:hypothetical protein